MLAIPVLSKNITQYVYFFPKSLSDWSVASWLLFTCVGGSDVGSGVVVGVVASVGLPRAVCTVTVD